MKSLYKITIGCLLLCLSIASYADVRIVITDGVNTAKPIAIVPFKWSGVGEAPLNIDEVIAADLRNSGQFNPIKTSDMPKMPETPSAVNAQDWRKLGIDAVVIGSIQPGNDGNYLITYQMVDTLNTPGAILSQNQYSVAKRWLRYAAHTASDEIFETLTGKKGAFRTRIAYIVKTTNSKFTDELRIADYDGYDQIVVHKSTEPLMSPAWSPDGKKLVYVTFEGGHSSLVMKTLETGALETIAAFPQHNGAPAFSPDGRKLAFALSKDGSLNIYVMDMQTRNITRVTSGRSNDTEPSWMPDNQTLVYTSDQAGRPQLYTININGGTPQRLTWDGLQNQDPSVSPDGRFVAMITTTPNGQFINRYDFDTGAYQILTNTFLDETPSVSPNSMMIIYSSTQGLGSILNLVSADGRFKATLPATDGQVRFPAWSPYL
ncbi:Tol-Pal system beta propeller repeat protein TolB [Utexia brackfieldae]|uniref:Tol-Pal system beta propeller repeat protein TolB n=1 Tax=Utexia brackfieldae TaxID=3074108 RepID=UPI00370D18F6